MAKKERKNLISIAKGKGKGAAKPKPVVKPKKEIKTETKPVSNEEIREIKAKERIDDLLKDVNLTPDSGTPVVSNDDETITHDAVVESKGDGWLEEQIGLLTEENEQLRLKLSKFSDMDVSEQQKGVINEQILKNILSIYTDLQNNLLGNNPEQTVWATASIGHLLNKFNTLFPFISKLGK